MSTRLARSRRVTQLALVVLAFAILAAALQTSRSGLLLAATTTLPLFGSAAWALRKRPRWGLWTAVLMIPYFSVALTDMLTDPGNRWTSGLIATLAVLIFFIAIHVTRLAQRAGSDLGN